MIEGTRRGSERWSGREPGDLPAARRAQEAEKARLSTVRGLVGDPRKRGAAKERLGAVRQALLGIDPNSCQGELNWDDVLRLVDTAARQPLTVLAGAFNTNLVVADKARGRRVLLRFRSRDDRIPPDTEGADGRTLLRPADAMVEARRLGVKVPRLLFATEPEAEHGSSIPVEVHEYVPATTLHTRYPPGVSLPRKLQAGIAKELVRLGSTEPSPELRARYPDAPRTCGDAAELEVGLLLRKEEAQRERFGSVFDAIGLAPGERSQFEHPAPELPARLVHYDLHELNLLLTKAGRPVLIDFDLARLGDPAHDVRGVVLRVERSEQGAQAFKRMYLEGMTDADATMAECLQERVALCSRLKIRRGLLDLPDWIGQDVRDAPDGRAKKAMKQRWSARAEVWLRRARSYLGTEVIPGGEFVAAVIACADAPR